MNESISTENLLTVRFNKWNGNVKHENNPNAPKQLGLDGSAAADLHRNVCNELAREIEERPHDSSTEIHVSPRTLPNYFNPSLMRQLYLAGTEAFFTPCQR